MNNNHLPEVFTIPEFCRTFHISRPYFYKLQKMGRTPRLIKMGRKRLITKAAALECVAQWEKRSA